MPDLTDEELIAIVRAKEHPDTCRTIPLRSLRAVIAADRALNAAPVAQAELARLYTHQLLDAEGKPNGVHVGTADRSVTERAYDEGETTKEVWEWVAADSAQAQAERAEVWIVVKEHIWEHGDGERPTLAYLWPSEFNRQVFASFDEAMDFAAKWPLGWVAMKLTLPAAPTPDQKG